MVVSVRYPAFPVVIPLHDHRSAEAKAYRKLYDTKAWKQRRLYQLGLEPLCRFCMVIGNVTPATVADHMVPHRGDPDLFFNGELQSLCSSCHSSAKQREENGSYSGAADLDGYPLDPRHPNAKL